VARRKAVVIMAAGRGTRMCSSVTKVLHPVAGRPMVHYPVRSALELGAERVVIVLGHQRDEVSQYLDSAFPGAPLTTVLQAEQLGTAHAVLCARDALSDFEGDIFILSGDVPTLPTEIIRRLDSEAGSSVVAVLGMRLADPAAYGRLISDEAGCLRQITEARDCRPEELLVNEVNAGVYRVDAQHLFATLLGLGSNNAQGEYYLTDIVQAATVAGRSVSTTILDGAEAVLAEGVNDRLDLAAAEGRMQHRLRAEAMRSGVTLTDPNRVLIHDGVTIGAETVIEPNVALLGQTTIGSGCVIEQGCRISNATLADHVWIKGCSHIEGSQIDSGCQVGPFARLREGTSLGLKVKVGNFVETKKARFDDGAKASHLSYIGDAHIGRAANIGAGTITCNYDGYRKFRTDIGAGAFIGSDTQLVAPVRVGAGAIVAAGTTVTQDVPDDALALSRAPQIHKKGWAAKKRKLEASREK
jgi:bifunctional UDP-N-acetylglucosamine pyrophosphorylase/glucosamine-1-phosphate N-acetyltransferase